MSFTGTVVELPLGLDGLTGTKNLAATSPGQLLQALNVQFHDGAVGKEGGASKYNSTAITGGASILGGWDWWPSDGAQRAIVYLDGGLIKKDSGGGSFGTTLVSGLSGSCVPVFVEGGAEAIASNRKLIVFNGVNAPYVLSGDGSTMAALATPPADWAGANQPNCGCIHENRLWAALRHRVYYSLSTNHEDFTSAGTGSVVVFPGEGEGIIQIMSYKSLLVIWKYPTGIYTIDTSSTTTSNWRVARLNRHIGGVSPHGAVQVNDDVLFLDQGGNFQLLSGIQEYGQVGAKDLSTLHQLKPFFDENVNRAYLQNVRAVFYNAKNEAHFALAGTGQSQNGLRLIVDFNRVGLPRFRYSIRGFCQSLWLRKDVNNTPRLTAGDHQGFVWHLDQSTRSFGDEGYTSSFQTAWTDLSHVDASLATRRKNGKFLEIVAEPKGNWDITADICWDGRVIQQVTFNMNPRGIALGSFILDTHELGDSTLIAGLKRRIVGSGKRFSVVFHNSAAGEDFNIAKAYLYFSPSDERILT